MESKFWTQVKNFKELIAVVVFVGGLVTGYVTLQSDVKYLREDVQQLTKQMEKTNEILMSQKELNGKIIQYMQEK
jgi:hypothetical protein